MAGELLYLDSSAIVKLVVAEAETPALRTLDAIHLATARSLGDDLGAICTYDARFAEAAAALGMEVLTPA